MTEAAPDISPPPETPEWAKTLRYIWHHCIRESEGIRKAPVATIVVWGALSYASYWYLYERFADRLGSLAAANTALQATVGQLQNELKGASPQLAAMQARRAAVRNKLLEFYVAVGPLIGNQIPVNWNDKKEMDEKMSSLKKEAGEWSEATATFIEQNLGPAARDRFLDISNMPIYSWNPNLEGYDTIMNTLSNRRKNLALLIETAAYDR